MNLVKCSNGHFYDADKYASCPHCGGGGETSAPTFSAGAYEAGSTAAYDGADDATVGGAFAGSMAGVEGGAGFGGGQSFGSAPGFGGGFEGDFQTVGQKSPVGPNIFDEESDKMTMGPNFPIEEDDNVTIRWTDNMRRMPVVGWLVATNGDDAGASFELKSGKNFIGRGEDMDVVLKGDKTVSRNRHAIILYEPKMKAFLVQPGESRELFYLNGNVVLNTEKISAYDILSIGETELIFIPFCGERFSWDKKEDK